MPVRELPVSPVRDALSAPVPSVPPPETGLHLASKRTRQWVAGVVAVILATGLFAFAVARFPSKTRSVPPEQGTVVRYTISLPPDQQLAGDYGRVIAISANGKSLAYIAKSGGTTQIYSKRLGEDYFQPSAGTQDASDLFFSPDGRFLVFWAKGQLLQMELETGETSVLSVWHPLYDHPGGVWAQDGSIYFSNGNEGPTAFGSSILRAVKGKGLVPLPHQPTNREEWFFVNQLLPGEHDLLVSLSLGPTQRSVIAYSVADGKQKVLLDPGQDGIYLPSGHLVYSWRGDIQVAPFSLSQMAVTGAGVPVIQGVATRRWAGVQAVISDTGTLAWVPSPQYNRQLCWVDRQGRATLLELPPSRYDLLALSPKGAQILLSRAEPGRTTAIWDYNLTNRNWTRLVSGYWENSAAAWSPDESQAVVSAALNGEKFENLYLTPIDPPRPERIAASPNPQFVQSWSATAGVLYTEAESSGTQKDIRSLSLQPVGAPSPLVTTPGNDGYASVSPDGHWLVYSSDVSGKSEVYLEPYPPSGVPQRLSTEGGTAPLWSPAGGEIFFRKGDAMWSIPWRGGKAERPQKLFSSAFTAATPWNRRYAVTPDGQRFLMIRDMPDAEDLRRIHVVVNWSAEVSRLVPGGH